LFSVLGELVLVDSEGLPGLGKLQLIEMMVFIAIC
jgi:hypothetical protein